MEEEYHLSTEADYEHFSFRASTRDSAIDITTSNKVWTNAPMLQNHF